VCHPALVYLVELMTGKPFRDNVRAGRLKDFEIALPIWLPKRAVVPTRNKKLSGIFCIIQVLFPFRLYFHSGFISGFIHFLFTFYSILLNSFGSSSNHFFLGVATVRFFFGSRQFLE